MEFNKLIRKRFSVRNFKEIKVEKEKVDLILQAGRVAPSGGNLQAQKLYVLENETNLLKLKKAANTYFAPLCILVCTNDDLVWTRPFDQKKLTDIDASIVTDHMMLQATELGLGTLWVCYFDPQVIKKEFNLPDNIVPVNILAIGYSNEKDKKFDRHERQRKPLSETVCFDFL